MIISCFRFDILNDKNLSIIMICLRVLTKVACDPNPDRVQVMQRMKIKYCYDGSGGHDIRLVFYLLKFEFVLLFYYVYEKIRFVSFAINRNSSRQTMDVGWRPSQRKAWRPITRGSDRSGRSCPVKHPRRTT